MTRTFVPQNLRARCVWLALLSVCAFSCSGSSGRRGGNAGAAGTASNGGTQGNGGSNGSSGSSGTMNGASGNAGSAGAGGTMPGMGFQGNPTDGEIGARCTVATDCRSELTCIPSSGDIGIGGPAGGLCTLPCMPELLDADCQALSTAAVCVIFNDGGTATDASDDVAYCSELCIPGTPVDPTVENKCHQRAELACFSSDGALGFCIPSCGSDVDCQGSSCDLNLGSCVADPPVGDPIGTACTTANDTCVGFCLPTDEAGTTGFCSGACTFGATGCGVDGASTEPPATLCYPGGLTFGIGDLGLCVQGCDCNDDCLSAGNVCLPEPGLQEALGRAGICAPPATAAPMSDAGAGAGDGGVGDAGVSAADPSVTGIICQ